MIQQIQQIFIPKTFNNYYLIPQRILGIEITKTRIRATQLYLQGKSITFEKYFEVIVETDQSVDYTQRVRNALKILAQQVDSPDIVRTSLSSALIITKELTVPFVDREKIRLMLPFELEGNIPFAITDAVTDFIITSHNEQTQQATIIAAIIQKQHISQHLSYFEETPFDPEAITVDIFDLYGLYLSIPRYEYGQQTIVLVDINMHITRIACITNKKLRLIRTLPKGLISLAAQVSKKLNQSNAKTLEDIIRFGLEDHAQPAQTDTIKEGLQSFWQDIQFTLQSFTTQLQPDEGIQKLLLLGDVTTIPGILTYVAQLSSIPTEIFAVDDLVTQNIITSTQRIPQTHIISLACAYPSWVTQECNLRQNEFALATTTKTMQQIITAGTLAFVILLSLIGYSFWVSHRLGRAVHQAEQEVVAYLQEQQLANEPNIVDALDEAEKKVEEEERLWFAFSRQRRFSFLEHLQKLSEAIDRVGIGLDLKKLVISENSITFDGKVKDYDALKVFEHKLRESNLFNYVPTLQEITFNNLKLPLKKANEVL